MAPAVARGASSAHANPSGHGNGSARTTPLYKPAAVRPSTSLSGVSTSAAGPSMLASIDTSSTLPSDARSQSQLRDSPMTHFQQRHR
ncbi:hypothetical protein CBOM_05066 [Ceraceosorus bombacis]|uniref:Uncharacterized protein n=1 Tax=Ceraceosorus bombacis TaxID=401625 RepID=A0A0P1BIG0_9BASI|nr:hypothetical protein CBOM_05066 [Ceraceosorus bombacis]